MDAPPQHYMVQAMPYLDTNQMKTKPQLMDPQAHLLPPHIQQQIALNHAHLTPQQQKYLQRNSLVNNPQALTASQQLEYVSERHGGPGNSQYDNVKMAMLAQHH
jgi:hypothetical protein